LGISTIIATIIIVSVSIVMAIAAAFWAMGIAGSFQTFEEVKFTSIYADPPGYYNATVMQPDGNWYNGSAYTIYIVLKNSGTGTATIDGIFLNNRPYDSALQNVTQSNLINQTLAAGKTLSPRGVITLPVDSTGIWTSGSAIEVKIHTAAGNSYSDTVVLP
jgi:hypothetical protein